MSVATVVEAICGAALAVSWQATILSVIVVSLLIVFSRWLSPGWRFGLWALVLARLTLMGAPESAFSLFNYTGVKFPAELPEGFTNLAYFDNAAASGVSAEEVQYLLIRIIASIWAAGALGLGFQWARSYIRVRRCLRRADLVGDATILNALADAENAMDIRPDIRLLQSPVVRSPMLFGCAQPCLVIPERMVSRLSAKEWRLVFLHEMAHLKRRDVVTNVWISILQIVHWFNPVLQWVFDQIRMEREVATDALALKHARPGERRLYAQTILKFVEDPCEGFTSFGRQTVALIDRDEEILWRFKWIAAYRRVPAWGILGAALVLVLAFFGLTDPEFPKPVTPFSFECIRVLVR